MACNEAQCSEGCMVELNNMEVSESETIDKFEKWLSAQPADNLDAHDEARMAGFKVIEMARKYAAIVP